MQLIYPLLANAMISQYLPSGDFYIRVVTHPRTNRDGHCLTWSRVIDVNRMLAYQRL